MSNKIAFRLLFPTLSVVFVSMLVVFLLVYQNEKEKIIKTHLGAMFSKVSITKNNFSFWMQEQVSIANALSKNENLIKFLSNPTDQKLLKNAEENLQRLYDNANFYENIAVNIKLADGKYVTRKFNGKTLRIYNAQTILDSVGGKTLTKGSIKMPFVYKALVENKLSISKPYHSLRRKNPIVVIMVPIHKGSKILGGLILAIKLSYFFEKYINNIDKGNKSFLFMVDSDGDIIVDKNKNNVLEKNIRNMVYGKELMKYETYTNRYTVNDEHIWISCSKEILTSWRVVAIGYENSIIVNELNSFLFKLLFVFILVTVVIFLLIYLITYRTVSSPLKRITKSLDEFSIDNFHILDNFHSSTEEFKQIKDSFSNMIEMLSASYLELQYSKNLLSSVADSIDALIFYKDKNFIYIGCNKHFADFIGKTKDEIIGKTDKELFALEQSFAITEADKKIFDTKESIDIIFHGKYPNGREVVFQVIKSLLKDASGNDIGVVGVAYDITQQKKLEEDIQHKAHYDALTSLPNRALLHEYFTKSIAIAQRNNEKLAVLFIDLDYFKSINDTFGHDIGDEVLKIISKRLSETTRDSDILARLGGDEFLIIYNNMNSPENVLLYATKLIKYLDEECLVNNQSFKLSASIGISIFPNDGVDQITLMKHADIAMYKAKELGRNNIQFFISEMGVKANDEMMLRSGIGLGMQDKEFFLVYQPQFDCFTSEMVGAEALVRWNSKSFGLVYPDKFISIAENTGMIISLGKWILEEACRQQIRWSKEFNMSIKVSVNVSIRQFQHTDFVKTVSDVINSTGIDPTKLELEITEGISMQNVDKSIQILNELKLLGVSIAMDDFGTGYSSLVYLKKFPIDKLKIDQAFVRDCIVDKDDRMLIKTIIAMSKGFGLKCVAEGVETREHKEFLEELSCDILQGYYFDKPLSVESFENRYLS